MVIRMKGLMKVKGLLTCLVKFYFLTWKEVVIEVYLIIIYQTMHFFASVVCVARTYMYVYILWICFCLWSRGQGEQGPFKHPQ